MEKFLFCSVTFKQNGENGILKTDKTRPQNAKSTWRMIGTLNASMFASCMCMCVRPVYDQSTGPATSRTDFDRGTRCIAMPRQASALKQQLLQWLSSAISWFSLLPCFNSDLPLLI